MRTISRAYFTNHKCNAFILMSPNASAASDVLWSVAGSVEQDHPLSSLPVSRQHSLSRTPQSPTTGQSLSRDLSGVSTGIGGRKTVRFADQPPPTSDRERPFSDGDRPSDVVGYTIRPHYPTRVTLSTFHSNPTIPTEL